MMSIDGLRRDLADREFTEPTLGAHAGMDGSGTAHRMPKTARGDGWKQRPTLTVDEAANVLRIGRSTAYSAVRSGQIPSLRLGRRILIPTAALCRMLERA